MQFTAAVDQVCETLSIDSSGDTRVGQFVNEAVVDFMRDAAPVASRFSFWTVPGQTDYDLERDIGAMEITQLRIVASGGTLTATVGGQVTAATAFDADADTWVTNLEALSTIDAGEVEVEVGEGDGTPDAPILVTIRFLERTNVVVTADGASLTGPDSDVQVTTLLDGGQAGVLRVLGDVPHDLNAEVTTDRYTVMGLSTLVLHVVPTTAEEIHGWCVPRPPVLSGTDEIPVPREWERAIIYRAQQLTAEWDRQDDGEIAKWEAKYEGEVGKCRRSRTRAVGGHQRSRLRASSQTGPNRTWMG